MLHLKWYVLPGVHVPDLVEPSVIPPVALIMALPLVVICLYTFYLHHTGT